LNDSVFVVYICTWNKHYNSQ